MRYLINDISASGDAEQGESGREARIVSLEQALSTAEVPVLDLEFMQGADLGKLFPAGAACTFAYTRGSPPVLAVGAEGGLVKISGDLVRLETDAATLPTGPALSAEGISVRVTAPGDGAALEAQGGEMQQANLLLELDAGLSAGYRGYYSCRG